MGQFFDSIPSSPDLAKWMNEQKIFFVGTAPLEGGNVNISPKGTVGTFHIVDESHVWYEDLTGSGSETIAHLLEPNNGRITLMFTAFSGPPRIVRLFGKGTAHFRGSEEYERYLAGREPLVGSRAVVVVEVRKVGSSCGYSIPFMEYVKEREVLDNWARKKEAVTNLSTPFSPSADPEEETNKDDLRVYWANRNKQSIDGLPSLGTFLFPPEHVDDHSSHAHPPSTSAKSACSKPSPPTPRFALPIPSLQTLSSHAAIAALAGAAVYAHDRGWLEIESERVRWGVGLVGATGAWVVGSLVGVPVPAPCCAMGM